MKRCPECRRDYYDDSLLYCLDDGSALLEGPATADRNEPVTAMMPEGISSPGGDEKETKIYASGDLISTQIKRHKFGALIVGGIVAVVLAGFGYGIYKFFDRPAAVPERPATAFTITRLTGDGRTRGARISPDGKFLAYIRAEGSARSVWLKQIQANSNIEIVKPGELDDFEDLVFSPDGNFVYFNAGTQKEEVPSVYRVPTLGGSPSKVFTNAFSLEFSPDGREVSFTRFDLSANEHSVYIANSDGSNERKLASRSGDQFFSGSAPWSPDGKNLAVHTGDDSLAPAQVDWVSIISTSDGTVSRFDSVTWRNIDDLAWHPAGDALIVSGSEITQGPAQLYEVAYPSGSHRRLTSNLHGHASVSITADGKSLVTGEIYSRSAVWVSPDLKPENAKQVMPNTGDTWGFGWTPDNRIVYVSDQTGDPELWVMDADGSNAKAITNDKEVKAIPVASSDGKYFVYAVNPGIGEIVRINVDGSNRVVLANVAGADNPDISPDGKWVVYSAWVDGKSTILRVPIEGGEAQKLSEGNAIEPRYSRDGSKLACFLLNEKTLSWSRLAIIPAEGGAPIRTFEVPVNTNQTRGPIWTPDDKGITVVIAPGERQELWLQPVDGSPGKQMTDVGMPGIARREYSRDGKRIAIVRAQGVGNAIMITDFR